MRTCTSRVVFSAGSEPADATRTFRLRPAAFGLALLACSPAFAQGVGQVSIVPTIISPAEAAPVVPVAPVAPASGTTGPVISRPAVSRRAAAGAQPVSAQPVVELQAANRQTVAMETGNGRILTLPLPASNVFVADPKVAEVRPASPNSLFVFGVSPGRTTVAAMDADGRVISQFDVSVRPSTFVSSEVEGMLVRLVPNSRIRVVSQPNGMMLTGFVGSPAESARAVAIVKSYLPTGQAIENQMTVQGSIQVNMRVRIVEMQRNVTRALGIDWQAMGSVGRFAVNFATGNGLGVASTAAGILSAGTKDINAVVDALAQDNLLRILAEPNLTVMSGQPGSFLAGGEFPIPVASTAGSAGTPGTITVAFKKYGVSLDVVPTVLSDGRINLHIAPEVSQLSNTGAVTVGAGNGSPVLSIPGLVVRRAETSVELGSGQSFAIAGLLQDQMAQNTSGITFLGELPIIGSLFRSAAYIRQETELVIIVTPYVVRPVDDPASLKTGTDHFTPPNDFERILLLRQVSANNTTPPPHITGAAGFIVQ